MYLCSATWYIHSQLGDEPHYKKQYMKKMEYTTKTGYNPLSLRDLGGGIDFAVTSSFIYRYRAFRRCQTRDRRKALCVSGLLTQMCWHTANDAVGRQIDAAWWIILPYSGKIWLRHVKCLTLHKKSK